MKNLYLIFVAFSASISMIKCDDDIVQLCEPGSSLDCLREYFSKNADCSVAKETKERVQHYEDLTIHLPTIDTTVYTTTTTLSQFNGTIETFKLNKKTNNIIVTVVFSNILCDAPGTIFAVGQDGKPPKVVTEYVKATFNTAVTAVAQLSPDGKLTKNSWREGQYSSALLNIDGQLYIGPKFSQSNDPVFQKALEGLMSDLPSAYEQILYDKVSYFFLTWLQNDVCDYGLSPVLYSDDRTVVSSLNEMDVDDESNISKPCEQEDDKTECAKEFFKKQGFCSSDSDAEDRSKIIDYNNIYYFPTVNATAFIQKALVAGLDGVVKEIYVDDHTKNLVMSVQYSNLSITTDSLDISLQLRGQENATVSDTAQGIYPSFTLTGTVPIGTNGLELEKMFVSNKIDEPATIAFGPKISDSGNPVIELVLKIVRENKMDINKQIFRSEALRLFEDFIKLSICNLK